MPTPPLGGLNIDQIGTWLSGGTFGVLGYLFYTRRIRPGRDLEELKAELAKKEQELKDVQAKFMEQVIPALVRNTDALAHYATYEPPPIPRPRSKRGVT